ncbi:MAG TPA: formate dehydrogenase subunit gamma, partial [Acidobacteria bacterium]|nr:formate dehydrogenase subunit gamma [Acidobacteriota bacterium]
MPTPLIHRFSLLERLVHWVVGLTFVVLLGTGLAFAYPSLFWLTTLLGGGAAARVLHPQIGALFGVGILVMFGLWVRDMFLDGQDRAWLGAIKHYAAHDREKVPPAGKYNAGQKLFFWVQSILGIVFVVTGGMLWFPESFGAAWLNTARLLHYAATLGGGLFLIVHVYL